ncbi:MAG TPA: zinc ribbon domain-containing protein [Azospirillum sp.]|nr:zinc ribbon domain-containing protein [Azospirillum sp.]
MPLYSYRCAGCGAEFELLVRASEAPACPACGGGALEKLVSRPAPPGKSAGILSNARTAAAGAGHFSNYSKMERAKVK